MLTRLFHHSNHNIHCLVFPPFNNKKKNNIIYFVKGSPVCMLSITYCTFINIDHIFIFFQPGIQG